MPHRCRTGYHDEPSNSCYTTHGCRCEGCTQLQSEYSRRWHERKRSADEEPPVHGRSGYNNYGCRCDVCTSAQGQYNRRYRAALAELRDRHPDEFTSILSGIPHDEPERS